ncbi:MAG: hypothetical protein U0169_25700 [Polyangiaceae bacterium]
MSFRERRNGRRPVAVIPSMLGVVAATVVACSARAPTGFVATLSTQLPIRHVVVKISGSDDASATCLRYDVRPGSAEPDAVELPASIGLQPASKEAESATVRVESFAYLGTPASDPCQDVAASKPSLRSESVVSYVPEAVYDLPVVFSLSCLGVLCDAGTTCRSGKCVPSTVDARRELARRTASGVSALACFDLGACGDVFELVRDPGDACVWRARSGRLSAAFTPYVRYRFADGREASEFLATDEYFVTSDGAGVELDGTLCDAARLGFVVGVGFGDACGPRTSAPICGTSRESLDDRINEAASRTVDAGGGDASIDATLPDADAGARDGAGGDATLASDGASDSASTNDGGADGGAGDSGPSDEDGGADSGGDGGATTDGGGGGTEAGGGDGGATTDPLAGRNVDDCSECCGRCDPSGVPGTNACFEGFEAAGSYGSERTLATLDTSYLFYLDSAGLQNQVTRLRLGAPSFPEKATIVDTQAFGIVTYGSKGLAVGRLILGGTASVDLFPDATMPNLGSMAGICTLPSGNYERLIASDETHVYFVYRTVGTTTLDWTFVRALPDAFGGCTTQAMMLRNVPNGSQIAMLTAREGQVVAAVRNGLDWQAAVMNFGTNRNPSLVSVGPTGAPIYGIGLYGDNALPGFLLDHAVSGSSTDSTISSQSTASVPNSLTLLTNAKFPPHSGVEGRIPAVTEQVVAILASGSRRIDRGVIGTDSYSRISTTGPNPKNLRATPKCLFWEEDGTAPSRVVRGVSWDMTR